MKDLSEPQTIREEQNATVLENRGNATVRESPKATARAGGLAQGSKFRGYNVIKQMPSNSTEADIFIIEKDRKQYILKLYRYGIEPKAEILKAITSLSKIHPKEFVNIFEADYDTDTKRWFEIQEYISNGSLQAIMNNISKFGQLQKKALFNNIAAEIGRALNILHENNLLHLDLKPSNVLIRSVKPFNLVLIDFGISTLLASDMSKKFTQTRGTPMYQSPESWAGSMNRASDWWGLGMILLEITSGKHPFSGLDYKVIASIMATRSVEIPSNIDEGQQKLLRGLLTRDPDKRWNWNQVSRWLKGEKNIPVFFEDDAKLPEQSDKNMIYIVFMGRKYSALSELATEFAKNEETWEKGRAFLLRGYITRWLEEAGDYDTAADIDRVFYGIDDSDAKTFKFIDTFGQNIPFIFCGHLVTLKNLLLVSYKALKREKLTAMEKKLLNSVSDGILLLCADFYLKKHKNSEQVQIIREALQNLEGKSVKDIAMLLYFYLKPESYYCPFIEGKINLRDAVKLSSILQCVPLRLEEWEKINVNNIVPDDLLQKMKSARSYHEFFAESYLNKMLVRAARCKNSQATGILRRHGAKVELDINSRDENGNTPLARAAIEKNYELAETLIAIGANVNDKSNKGDTPLMLAIANNTYKIAKLLIDKGANINDKNDKGDTPLIAAVYYRAYDIAKLLIKKGANVNARSNSNITPLMLAIANNIYEVAELLISRGANVNDRYNSGDTLLMLAIVNKTYDIAKLLIGKGANVNDENNGSTPLMLAITNKAYDIAALLVDKGAKVNRKDDYVYTLLWNAIISNDYGTAKLLIGGGADVNKSHLHDMPLTLAVKRNDYDFVKLLIDNGANVNIRDDQNNPPLEVAITKHAALNVVKLLLDNGANVNDRTYDGGTPLMLAVKCNDYDFVKLLIDYGANVNDRNDSGYTPLMTAVTQHVAFNVVKLLLDNGANINIRDAWGNILLIEAIKKNATYDVIKLLLDYGANVNIRDDWDNTPIIEAVRNNASYEIIKLLIDSGADILIENGCGETALSLARRMSVEL